MKLIKLNNLIKMEKLTEENKTTNELIEEYDDEECSTLFDSMCTTNTTTKKRFTGKPITFDLSEASSAKPLMEHIIQHSDGRYKSSIGKEKADVRYMYCNADEEELTKVLCTKGKTLSRYPGIKGVCHKDQFSKWTKICYDMSP